jgi:hypothetical protein
MSALTPAQQAHPTEWDNATTDSIAQNMQPTVETHHNGSLMCYGVEFSHGLMVGVSQNGDVQHVMINYNHEQGLSYLATWNAEDDDVQYDYSMDYNNGCSFIPEKHKTESHNDRTTLIAFTDGSAVTHAVEDFENKFQITKLTFGDNVTTIAFRQDENADSVMLIKHETAEGGEVARFTNGVQDMLSVYKHPEKKEQSALNLNNLYTARV